MVQRLGERIARALDEEPVVLEPEAHRARLADLLARIGGLNHYELLEIPTSATAEEVHAGYERLGRLAHPANAARLGLTSREEGAPSPLRSRHARLRHADRPGAASPLQPDAS